MANELIPAQIANGGTGSVGVSGVRAPDYRDVQAPEGVRTDLPDNGAAMRAAALSGLFKEFEGVSSDVLSKTELQAGTLAGAASGATGSPQYKAGLARLTTYGQAFNNAATGAYAVEAEAHIDDTAARLRVEANNNPQTFYATLTAARDADIKNAPAMAVPMLTEKWNTVLANGMAAISGDQATEQRNLQRQTYSVGIDRQTSRVAILQGSANPEDQLKAQDEQVKLSLLIDGGKNAGLYSEAEATAMHSIAARTITAQVFSTQVDRELANPDGDPMALVDRFRKMHIDNLADPNAHPILGEDEFKKLMQDATTKIREYRLTEEMESARGKAAEAARLQAGDDKYTELALRGQLTNSMLADAVASHNLKSERATALSAWQVNQVNKEPKSNPGNYLKALHDPDMLDVDALELSSRYNLNQEDTLKLYKEQQKQITGLEGTPEYKDAFTQMNAALKIAPGTPSAMLTDEQKLAIVKAKADFTTRINTVDPAHRRQQAGPVMQQVIDGIHKTEMQNQITQLQSDKDTTMRLHGPGGSDKQWDAKKLKAYMDDNAAQIKALQSQLSGK